MITEKSNRKIESNGNASGFSIQASGKMFHMVISGLYSNKAQSITREIWSNAFDAHCMSGQQDRPFDVTFPTALDPTFTCRDYGAGLSPDFMLNQYTILGHSEKENTNQAVGKWGVGRMSPLSYTDSFTVTSIHSGLKSFYSVTTGSDGAPTITPMGSEATSEPSGLSVSFPVKHSDLSSFQKAARVVSYGFPVTPNVTNGDPLRPLRYTVTGEGYTIYLDEHGEVRGPQARMGCVLYPLSVDHVNDSLRYQNIIIDFPIGSLEVTASREQLSYGANDPTVKSIKRYSTAVLNEIKKDAEAELAKCDTLFEAQAQGYKLSRSTSVFRLNDLLWRGAKLFPNSHNPTHDLGTTTSFTYGVTSRDGNKNVSKNWRNLWSFNSTTYSPDGIIRVFIEKASGKGKDVRAAQRIASQVSIWENFIWIRTDDNTDKAELDRFIGQLGKTASVVYVKDVADPGPSTKSVKREVKVKTWVTDHRNYNDYTMPDEEFQKGGLYVETASNALVNNPYDSAGHFHDIYKQLAVYDERLNKLIRVPKTVLQDFKDAPQWIEANTLIGKLLKDNEKKIVKSYINHETVVDSFAQTVHLCFKEFPLPSDLDDLRKRMMGLKQNPNACASHALINYLDKHVMQAADRLISDTLKTLQDKYPLLKSHYVYRYSDKTIRKNFAEYTMMVDLMNKMSDTSTPTEQAA